MDQEVRLREEIDKWTSKIEIEREKIELINNSKEVFLKNIDAYISDSKHFLKKEQLVESFEALIWAWAYITIGKDEEILKERT